MQVNHSTSLTIRVPDFTCSRVARSSSKPFSPSGILGPTEDALLTFGDLLSVLFCTFSPPLILYLPRYWFTGALMWKVEVGGPRLPPFLWGTLFNNLSPVSESFIMTSLF